MSTAIPFLDAHLASFKSLDTLDNGDILIEGTAANYALDKEDEHFVEGSFGAGLRRFMQSHNPVLCYSHKPDVPVGRVLSAEAIPGKGVHVKAVVNYQPEGSPWRHIYDGVRKKSIASFSFGGIFKRSGNKIVDVEVVELSICGISVGRGTDFRVVAGKALTAIENDDMNDEVTALRNRANALAAQLASHTGKSAGMSIAPTRAVAPEPDRMAFSNSGRVEIKEASVDNTGQHAAEREESWRRHRAGIMRARREEAQRCNDEGRDEPDYPMDPPREVPSWWGRKDGAVTRYETVEVGGDYDTHDELGRPYKGTLADPELSAEQLFALKDAKTEAERTTLRERFMAALRAQGGAVPRPQANLEPKTVTRKYDPYAKPEDWDETSPERGPHESPEEFFARKERLSPSKPSTWRTSWSGERIVS